MLFEIRMRIRPVKAVRKNILDSRDVQGTWKTMSCRPAGAFFLPRSVPVVPGKKQQGTARQRGRGGSDPCPGRGMPGLPSPPPRPPTTPKWSEPARGTAGKKRGNFGGNFLLVVKNNE